MAKTKYDAIHILGQDGWSDEEIRAIGLTLQDEGKVTIPERPWVSSHNHVLTDIIVDGSAKTFVYKKVDFLGLLDSGSH